MVNPSMINQIQKKDLSYEDDVNVYMHVNHLDTLIRRYMMKKKKK